MNIFLTFEEAHQVILPFRLEWATELNMESVLVFCSDDSNPAESTV